MPTTKFHIPTIIKTPEQLYGYVKMKFEKDSVFGYLHDAYLRILINQNFEIAMDQKGWDIEEFRRTQLEEEEQPKPCKRAPDRNDVEFRQEEMDALYRANK